MDKETLSKEVASLKEEAASLKDENGLLKAADLARKQLGAAGGVSAAPCSHCKDAGVTKEPLSQQQMAKVLLPCNSSDEAIARTWLL